jgi:hypothetical protein
MADGEAAFADLRTSGILEAMGIADQRRRLVGVDRHWEGGWGDEAGSDDASEEIEAKWEEDAGGGRCV